MSLSTYYLEYGRHVGQLRRRRRHVCAPMSNTASHDNQEKINSWVSFSFLYEYRAPLGSPLGRRSSAKIYSLPIQPQHAFKSAVIRLKDLLVNLCSATVLFFVFPIPVD